MKFRNFTQKLLAITVLSLFVADAAFSQENFAKRADVLQVSKNRREFTGPLASKRLIKKPSSRSKKLSSKYSNINKAPGDTLYFQNFQFTTWPTDLIRLKLDNLAPGNNPGSTINTQLFGNNAWVTTSLPPDPNRWAASLSWSTTLNGTVNRWMVTPPITLTEANKLSWLAQASNPDFRDGYEVRICTNCPATITAANVAASFATVLFSIDEEEANDVFVKREVDLSDYANQTVRLAFRNNSSDMDRLYIDDILVTRTPEFDVLASEILSPDTSIFDCAKSNFPALVSVRNAGAKTAYQVNVKLKSTGPINDSVTFVIDSLEKEVTDTILFADGLDLSALGEYQLDLSVSIPNDAVPQNNETSSIFIHKAPETGLFSADFDDLTTEEPLPAGWFSSSIFLPLIEGGGFNGTNALEIPVFNNNPTFGSSPDNNVNTPKFVNIPSGSTFSVKYKILKFTGAEHPLADGDTVYVNVYKNCELSKHSVKIHSGNQSISTEYQKVFIPMDSLQLQATDNVSFELRALAAPTTASYALDFDEVTLGSVKNFDISLINLVKPENTIIKKTHIQALKARGSVFNEGQETVTPIRLVATASPLVVEDTARISTLQGGFSKSFTTADGFNFEEAGEYTVEVTASSPNQTDPDLTNNKGSFNLTLSDSTMAKDFGDPVNTNGLAYPAGSGGKKIFANAVRTVVRDTLTSVSVFIGAMAADVRARAFFASRNTAGTGWVEDSSATIVDIPMDQANSWVTLRYRLRTGAFADRGRAVLPNTNNLYGIKIRSGNPGVLFNFENTSDDGSWIFLGGQWLGTQDLTVGTITWFIRPNFGRPQVVISTSQIEKSLQFAELVPNPTAGSSQLSIMLNKNKDLSLKVFSIDGRCVATKSAQGFVGANRIDLPVNGLQKGIYLVNIQADGFTATKKLIVE